MAVSPDEQPGARIDLVAIVVHDYDEAIDFFVRALRFELTEDRPAVSTATGEPKRWVVVRPPDGGTGLLLARAANDKQTDAVGNQTAGRVGFFFQTDDFAEMHAHMTSHGVEFLEEPRHEAYGTVAVFRDVAGNRWDLLGPPGEQQAGE